MAYDLDGFTKVTLKDRSTRKKLSAKSIAESIYFSDGESLQYKLDNNTLADLSYLENLEVISPTVEVAENDTAVYKLKITDKNGTIITPNLIGPEGPKGKDVNSNGDPLKITDSYEQHFTVGDFAQAGSAYVLRINRTQHKLGFYPRVISVLKFINDSEIVNVDYTYKRLVNGDVVFITDTPFSGMVYLEGNNNANE